MKEDSIAYELLPTMRSYEKPSMAQSQASLVVRSPFDVQTIDNHNLHSELRLPNRGPQYPLSPEAKSPMRLKSRVSRKFQGKLQGKLVDENVNIRELGLGFNRVVKAEYTGYESTGEEGEIELRRGIPKLKWCAYCRKETSTETMYRASQRTFWYAMVLFFMGGLCGCFMLPYMAKGCQESQFVCIRCKKTL